MSVKTVTPNKARKETKDQKNKSVNSQNNSEDSPVYHQSDLFLPKNRVGYYIYKPARTLAPNAPIYQKAFNAWQLAYYKYQLATGLYMMNERERAMINLLVVASIALTLYHFVL